jgi:hypothetical protein
VSSRREGSNPSDRTLVLGLGLRTSRVIPESVHGRD